MTSNQVNYLGVVETRRNNMANNEREWAKHYENARHNLVIEKQAKRELKETTRSHKANEKNTLLVPLISGKSAKQVARINRDSNIKSSSISAAATKYAADTAAQASKYATKVNAKTQWNRIIADLKIADAKNITSKDIAKMNNNTSKALKIIDASIASNQTNQKEKDSLRRYRSDMIKYKKDLAIAEANNNSREKTEAWKAILGLMDRIGKSGSIASNKRNKKGGSK